MTFKELIALRRSHRKFTADEVAPDDLSLILRAALMSPTSKSCRSWQFVVVDDPVRLRQIADAKSMGGQFLAEAPLAVVVLGDGITDDCWIEDCSIAAFAMQLQAADLGLATCWVQMRGRGTTDGESAEAIVRGVLGIPDNLRVLCVVAVGHPAEERKPQNEERLKWENVHIDLFSSND